MWYPTTITRVTDIHIAITVAAKLGYWVLKCPESQNHDSFWKGDRSVVVLLSHPRDKTILVLCIIAE